MCWPVGAWAWPVATACRVLAVGSSRMWVKPSCVMVPTLPAGCPPVSISASPRSNERISVRQRVSRSTAGCLVFCVRPRGVAMPERRFLRCPFRARDYLWRSRDGGPGAHHFLPLDLESESRAARLAASRTVEVGQAGQWQPRHRAATNGDWVVWLAGDRRKQPRGGARRQPRRECPGGLSSCPCRTADLRSASRRGDATHGWLLVLASVAGRRSGRGVESGLPETARV